MSDYFDRDARLPGRVVVAEGMIKSEASDLSCARCRAKLFRAALEGFEVLGCGSCGGVWLSNESAADVMSGSVWQAGRLAATLAEKTKPDPAALTRAAACPDCQQALVRVHAAGIELDVCPEHGTWFDRGEIERLMRAAKPAPAAAGITAVTPSAPQEIYPWLARLVVLLRVLTIVVFPLGVLQLLGELGVFDDGKHVTSVLAVINIVLATGIAAFIFRGLADAGYALLDLAGRPVVR